MKMSQYQPNTAPNRSFIEKINSKFSSLSVSSPLSSGSDHDGTTEDQTLIHKAFVKFFNQRNEPYPEWLGIKELQGSRQQSDAYYQERRSSARGFSGEHQNSQYQPARESYNSINQHDSRNGDRRDFTTQSAANALGGYTRRTNSRLQEMYNKSKQRPTSDSNPSMVSNSTPASRANSTSQMRRDRVLNGSQGQLGEPRSSWGR